MRCILSGIILCLSACSSGPSEKYPHDTGSLQEFSSRDAGIDLFRPVIYRAFIPFHWQRIDPDPSISIKDTMKPVCEFIIGDSTEKIRLTIHTFPFNETGPRIPSNAQVTRWKNQFQELDPSLTYTVSESHGGFFGLRLEAQGNCQNENCQVLAWSMQLAPEHERWLRMHETGTNEYKLADYTLKAVGKPDLIEKHKKDIQNFADSFEFIEEMTTSL